LDLLILVIALGLLTYFVLQLEKTPIYDELQSKVKELKDKLYCEFDYNERLLPHSYKLIQITENRFKLQVCDQLDVVQIFLYDQEGYLIEQSTVTYGEHKEQGTGEPASDFPVNYDR